MELKYADLKTIVENSSTLDERLNGSFTSIDSEKNYKICEQRLNFWKEKVYKSRPNLFDRWLELENTNEETIKSLLGNVTLNEGSKFPEWANKLTDIINYVSNFKYKEIENKKIPFFHFFQPFVEYTLIEIKKNTKNLDNYFTEKGITSISNGIYNRLFPPFHKVLLLEFNVYKLRQRGTFGRIIEASENYSSEELYLGFAKHLLNEKLITLFLEYSYLARLISNIIINEINNVSTCLSNFISDKEEIENKLIGNKLPKITSINSGLSDPHLDGKSVIKFNFENDEKLLFKPKVTKIDSAFNKLLESFPKEGLSFDFKPINVIEKDNYCWVEFINSKPCETKEEVAKYYKRIGGYLALIYILNGNDYHSENIIASGEYPVLVDLETIMHPVALHETFIDSNNPTDIAGVDLHNSVMRTGLLPNWAAVMGDVQFDMSGLGAFGEQETPFKYNAWENINSDKMQVVKKDMKFAEKQNMPYLKDKVHIAYDYIDEILDGFKDLYNLIKDKPYIITDEFLNDKKLRYVYRATQKYGTLLQHSFNPNLLQDGIQRGIYYDFLSLQILENENSAKLHWEIYKSELRQFANGDIPIFFMMSESSDFVIDNDVIKNITPESTAKKINTKVSSLSNEDLKKQIRYINGAIQFRDIDKEITPEEFEEYKPSLDLDTLPKNKFIESAKSIIDLLKEYKIENENTISWIGIGFHHHSLKPHFKPVDSHMYEGTTGIGLFLAAYYKITKDESALNMFNKIVNGIESLLVSNERNNYYFNSFAIGISSGITSIIYCLTIYYQLLGNKKCLELAEKFAEKINDDNIKKDTKFDIIAGSAGAILAFLKLYSLTNNKDHLKKAVLCGEHILNNRKEFNGFKTISTVDDKALTGFSHGAAGFAYALTKLYEKTNDQKYLDAAEEFIKYEDSLLNEQHSNWPDLREDQSEEFKGMSSWCHGGPGIALARFATLNTLDNKEIKRDINNGLNLAENNANNMLSDHCCCGNIGLNELLYEAGKRLENQELVNKSIKNVSNLIEDSQRLGIYRLFRNKPVQINNFGFMQGLTGIGYHLLKFTESENLPSVLIFE